MMALFGSGCPTEIHGCKSPKSRAVCRRKGNSLVIHAQIERLRTLKKRIRSAWRTHEHGPTEAEAVLIDLEQLVDILLMEKEGHDGDASPASGER